MWLDPEDCGWIICYSNHGFWFVYLSHCIFISFLLALIFRCTRLLLLNQQIVLSVWTILPNTGTWQSHGAALLEALSAYKSGAECAYGSHNCLVVMSCLVVFCLAVGKWETVTVRVCACLQMMTLDLVAAEEPHSDNREQCCQISCDITPGPQPAIRPSSLPKLPSKLSEHIVILYTYHNVLQQGSKAEKILK